VRRRISVDELGFLDKPPSTDANKELGVIKRLLSQEKAMIENCISLQSCKTLEEHLASVSAWFADNGTLRLEPGLHLQVMWNWRP
jgi:hypothetical protein